MLDCCLYLCQSLTLLLPNDQYHRKHFRKWSKCGIDTTTLNDDNWRCQLHIVVRDMRSSIKSSHYHDRLWNWSYSCQRVLVEFVHGFLEYLRDWTCSEKPWGLLLGNFGSPLYLYSRISCISASVNTLYTSFFTVNVENKWFAWMGVFSLLRKDVNFIFYTLSSA